MHPYLTYREEDPNGGLQYYILQKEHPHYVGVVRPDIGGITRAQVPHHALWVCYAGTLQGMLLPARNGIYEEVSAAMQAMALWFYEHRIQVNPKKYQKWHFAPPKTNS